VRADHDPVAGSPKYSLTQKSSNSPNLVALEDAYGLHVIDGNRSLPLERCAALIEGYARVATGCESIGRGTIGRGTTP